MSAPATCAICASPAKYTCPRCATRTCSLPCSTAHKSTTGCTGIRDKAAFVPLKDYGYGKLMDDYVFLEEGKRRAEAWGREIVGMKMVKEGPTPGRMVALQRALRDAGVVVEFLPEGMERRKKNQSHYNQKTRLIQLSMEFKYPSPDPLDPSSLIPHAPVPTCQMQNIPSNETTSLARIYTTQARKIPSHYPAPTTNIADTADDADKVDPTQDLVFAIPVYEPTGPQLSAPTEPHIPTTTAPRFYEPLPATTSLPSVLRGTSFLEYPTVHVFLKAQWEEAVRRAEFAVVPRREVVGSKGIVEGNVSGGGHGRDRPEGRAEAKRPRIEGSVDEGSAVQGTSVGESAVDESAIDEPAVERSTVEKSPVEEPAVEKPTVDAPPVDTRAAQPHPTTDTTPVERVPEQSATDTTRPTETSGLLALDYGTESEEGM